MDETKKKHLTFEEVFRHLDILMATMGLNKFYQSGNPMTKFRIFQWILCAISSSNLALLLIGTTMYVFTSESLFNILETMPNVFFCTMALVKFTTLMANRKRIYEVMDDLKLLWPRSNDEVAINRFHKIVSPTSELCLLYLSVTAGTAFAYGMTPILDALIDYVRFGQAHMKMVFLIWYPFDYEETIPRFLLVFISQFWGGFTAANLMTIGDTFLCTVIALICYQFETICDSIKAIQPIRSDVGNCEVIKIANDSLIRCILYHSRLLRLCQLLEDIFSFAMFINFTISSIVICEVLFNIMVVPLNKISIYLLYIATITLQVFMLCWHSEKLIRQSSRLYLAAYESGWYNADKQFGMKVVLLQIRAQKPVALTAMKFATLSLNTFLNIVASAWSYFTLLRHLYQK